MTRRVVGDPDRVLALMRAGRGAGAELVVEIGPRGGFRGAYVGLQRVSENAWMLLLALMAIRCLEGDGLRAGLVRYGLPHAR